jgi:nitrogen fixation-related uncharacterized protein
MEGILTLHDFMLYTKSVTYILVVVALLGLAGFFWFLNERDEDDQDEPGIEH